MSSVEKCVPGQALARTIHYWQRWGWWCWWWCVWQMCQIWFGLSSTSLLVHPHHTTHHTSRLCTHTTTPTPCLCTHTTPPTSRLCNHTTPAACAPTPHTKHTSYLCIHTTPHTKPHHTSCLWTHTTPPTPTPGHPVTTPHTLRLSFSLSSTKQQFAKYQSRCKRLSLLWKLILWTSSRHSFIHNTCTFIHLFSQGPKRWEKQILKITTQTN